MQTTINLTDLVNRNSPPNPWSEGEKIPWNDPGFSARMLKEHLNQNHDLASRRLSKIEKQVGWIHQNVLEGRPKRVLELGCGPGLYTSCLAQLGHECVGIDFSPASIAYAAAFAADQGNEDRLRCTYLLHDIRTAAYGSGFGLVMLIFGEFNVFRTQDACLILHKAHAALDPGGFLLLEPHTEEAVRRMGMASPEWYSVKSGLFSDKPHLCLEESFWDERSSTATIRYFIIDAATGAVSRYASSTQAYCENEYYALLKDCGFEVQAVYPSLMGVADESQADFFAILARKQEDSP